MAVFHGTLPTAMIQISAQGFASDLGAGSWALHEHFGVPVGGVYVAPTLLQPQPTH